MRIRQNISLWIRLNIPYGIFIFSIWLVGTVALFALLFAAAWMFGEIAIPIFGLCIAFGWLCILVFLMYILISDWW